LIALGGCFGVLLLVPGERLNPELLMALCGASGALSTLLMAIPIWRSLWAARPVWRRYLKRGFLGHRFVVEYFLVSATQNISVLLLGLLATPSAVGAMRGMTTLFGPLRTVFNAV